MLNNPGKTFSLFHIPKPLNFAFTNSMTPRNITSAFKITGIYPMNSNIFTDEDFLTNFVTDREAPTTMDHSALMPTSSATDREAPTTMDHSAVIPSAPSISTLSVPQSTSLLQNMTPSTSANSSRTSPTALNSRFV